MVRVRFAPSPTGYLHVGNARTALVNWLFARKEGGTFVLRLDDTDRERSRPEFAEAIRADLRWLGLAWDEEYAQSARLDRYADAAGKLKAAGRLYACYETPEELDRWRKARQRRGLPPVYSREARDEIVHGRGEREGRAPHWRFAIDRGAGRRIAWDDLVRGPVEFDAVNIADPVLVKSDGQPLYGLSSVVDDIDLSISHVVRGEDHVANTAQQVQLFAALGADPARIAFAHLPLLTGTERLLSKREGALSLRDLRADGIEPMAVNALLAALGTSDPVEPAADLDLLAMRFAWSKFGRASPQFDPAALSALNARLLHDLPFASVRDRLAAMGLEGADAAFWCAVRPNIARLAEAADWWRIVAGPVEPAIGDRAFLDAAQEALPPEPWGADTWTEWTAAISSRTGRKGKALFQPLRLALTGREHGPELKNLLPLIGRARAAARLSGQAA